MAKLIDDEISDETLDKYMALAQRIQDRCSNSRIPVMGPNPLLVATLMSNDLVSQNVDGLWHQLEAIWVKIGVIHDDWVMTRAK